jgi:uncharacterized protein (TIGR02246 family)
MKTAFTALLLACVPLAGALGQTAKAGTSVKASAGPDEQTIARIAEAWRTAYNGGDAAKVASLYMEDGYYLSAHILAHGRRAIEAYWRRGIAAEGHVDFIKPLAVFASGGLAYAAGIYQATNAGVTVDGRILLVFRKINGEWLIAAHQTVVRDQP